MNPKLIFVALGVILCSNSLIFFKNDFMELSSHLLLLLSIAIALMLWYLFLKKEVPIEFKKLQISDTVVALPILLISLGAIAINFSINTSVDTALFFMMLSSALLVGIYEEILFRAIALKALLKAGLGTSMALYLSALIFSLFHMPYLFAIGIDSLFLFLNTFMMGLFFAVVYLHTKNILLVIGIHTLWDIATFINQSLPLSKTTSVLTIVLLLATLLYFTWSLKNIKKLKESSL